MKFSVYPLKWILKFSSTYTLTMQNSSCSFESMTLILSLYDSLYLDYFLFIWNFTKRINSLYIRWNTVSPIIICYASFRQFYEKPRNVLFSTNILNLTLSLWTLLKFWDSFRYHSIAVTFDQNCQVKNSI